MPQNEHAHPNHERPKGPVTTSISGAIEKARFNEHGVAMTPLVSDEIGGQNIDALLVSMKPGAGVGVHLHEHGGEVQTALTPVRGVFGIPRVKEDGSYEWTDAPDPEDRQVKFEVVENKIYTPDDITAIEAGLVHGYGNPSATEDAHIVFTLPHTHADASDKLLADEGVAPVVDPISQEAYERYAGDQSLAIVRRNLGHMAHEHTPPAGG